MFLLDGGFELEADVHFDMYISTAPCGDSRCLFNLHELAESKAFIIISGINLVYLLTEIDRKSNPYFTAFPDILIFHVDNHSIKAIGCQ